jgi:hypothetical protein
MVERCKTPGATPGELAGGTPALRRVRFKPLTGGTGGTGF